MTIRTRSTAHGRRAGVRNSKAPSDRTSASAKSRAAAPATARAGQVATDARRWTRGVPPRAAPNRESRARRPQRESRDRLVGALVLPRRRSWARPSGRVAPGNRARSSRRPIPPPPTERHSCASRMTRGRRRGRRSAGSHVRLRQIMRGWAAARSLRTASQALRRYPSAAPAGSADRERSAAPRSSRPGCRPRGTSRPPGRRRSA
ncbi:MAG: hypothetical protein K0S35_3943 [Geminicoccaceae bacterium]|nr:hypothetical protein [Geminicoccaceae bacterium]